MSLGTLNFLRVVTDFNWVNNYGCSRGVIFPWRKPCTEGKWVTNSLIQFVTRAVPIRSAAGERQTVQGKGRRSVENLQRLCEMSCPSSLDAAFGKEGKGRRRKRRRRKIRRKDLEVWELGQEPNHSYGWNKRESTKQNQAEKWTVMERSGVRGALKRSLPQYLVWLSQSV